ncbi:YoaK family protein [Gordonia soli]|uniref:DUF1275 family protein n=1 Tax=Gordonia soli NBRC 108243 TaxID=1223545 RepID=M0QMJ8_9ACTN|nr:YoaK family protein [Gordonia soli]GAC69649.1 hypothetical protein GS4_26_00970 [Gordonia soli NBRC 108243]
MGAGSRATTTTLRFALIVTGAAGFLDAYTYLARGGVFANAQTANVVLGALDLANGRAGSALAHLWPILAFVAGVASAAAIKAGRMDNALSHPIRWTMLAQAVLLVVVGFLPASWPPGIATVPIAFVAAMQFELFRTIGELPYMAIATTGNLARLVESGYTATIERDTASRRNFRIYIGVVGAFIVGAVVGAFATETWGIHAVWVPAAVLVGTLVLFVVDERRSRDETARD